MTLFILVLLNHLLGRGTGSSPHQTAVDWDDRPGYIVGEIGRQELDHLGAILDGPEPPKGDQLGPITIALDAPSGCSLLNPTLPEAGHNRAEYDRADGDREHR